jgi:glutamine amidotransferase
MITIVDYGLGNIKSVRNALKFLGHNSQLACTGKEINSADKLILPGVGAFKEGMKNITELGIHDNIIDFAKSGKPILGICLGYQILTQSSEEFGFEKGLGIINARCQKLSPQNKTLPHIGWNKISITSQDNELYASLTDKYFYFVHSFGVFSDFKQAISGTTCYGGQNFLSVIQQDNIIGVQFHPEKSGPDGINFLKKFLE